MSVKILWNSSRIWRSNFSLSLESRFFGVAVPTNETEVGRVVPRKVLLLSLVIKKS